MQNGTVRWYDEEKGFGFIIPDAGGRDVYFLFSNVESENHEISNNQRVEFEITLGRKGPEAIHIRPL